MYPCIINKYHPQSSLVGIGRGEIDTAARQLAGGHHGTFGTLLIPATMASGRTGTQEPRREIG